jgi:F-type H+-transporting ATPase subunit a
MHDFNWLFLISKKITHENIHVFTALLVAVLLIGASLWVRKKLIRLEQSLVPSDRFSLTNTFEVVIENILSLMEGVMGPNARRYFPLIATLFVYIFTCNLLGVIPGFLPPTDNVNTNAACALTVFVYYNYMGIKEHGLINYIKHFMGPIWWLGPLMLVIELISHLVRPVSLSLRLFGNITGDHLVLQIFSDLVPLIIPVIFMILGIFVAFIQAFVFTLLSMIYIALATAHEEH